MNSGIILMAGSGERSRLDYNKTLYNYFGKPLFIYSLDAFCDNPEIDEVFLVINKQDEENIKKMLNPYDNVVIVYGGKTRNESLKNALEKAKGDKIIVHDAARPNITKNDIKLIIDSLDEYDLSTLYHKVVDTIKDGVKTLNRDNLKAVTTPQGFRKNCIPVILDNNQNVLDELQIFEDKPNYKIGFVEEAHDNKKFTNPSDFENPDYLIGHSLDFHPLVDNRPLILGGVKFDYPKGLYGHSDADVVYHAATEAIIGALQMGDIGTLFPDNDDKYLNIDSSYFLKYMKNILKEKAYEVNNLDVIIYLEEPNLKKYKLEMAKNIAYNLGINEDIVNVKATTMEKCGVIGNKEGISAEAIVLLRKVKELF